LKAYIPGRRYPMKIVEVKTYMVDVPPPHWGGRYWIFVKLVTDDSIEGVGECTYHIRLNHVVTKILKEPIQWENGYIIPSTKPGLGVELNEKVLEKHTIVL
jgi:L-alanine-DL-glutamate epimerase-like enolase superfamily enzyme